jgi:hypothetical protein
MDTLAVSPMSRLSRITLNPKTEVRVGAIPVRKRGCLLVRVTLNRQIVSARVVLPLGKRRRCSKQYEARGYRNSFFDD